MNTAILHYSASPVIGGVEAVILAHAGQFAEAGSPLTVIAGRGEAAAMPPGVNFLRIDEIDTLYPEISAATKMLNSGKVPRTFKSLVNSLENHLRPILSSFDHVIVHNVLTKHFNLPLTAALIHLLDEGVIKHTIAWCHDLSWSSASSRYKVHPGYPWDLLKQYHANVTYVAVSKQRHQEVVDTFGCSPQDVHIIYNGVAPGILFGFSVEGASLVERLDLLSADLILLMPVRVTQAKNIELAIELVAALKQMHCRPKLVLTGPPDPHDPASIAYYRSLLDLRHRFDVDREMHFVYESGPKPEEGYLIHEQIVAELYRVADAILMPSHREGFGMPVLEAGLLGTPIIATSIPAIQELVRDKCFIIDKGTKPVDLANQVLQWLNAKPEHNLRVEVRQKYTWNNIFRRNILPLLEPLET